MVTHEGQSPHTGRVTGGTPAFLLKLLGLARIADEVVLACHFQKAHEQDGFILVPILVSEQGFSLESAARRSQGTP